MKEALKYRSAFYKSTQLKEDIKKLLEEKKENEKLKGTKFEQEGINQNIIIDEKISENREEEKEIFKDIPIAEKISFEKKFSKIESEIGFLPLSYEKTTMKVDFDMFSEKAVKNLNRMFLSETLQRMFRRACKRKNGSIKLMDVGGDYGFSVHLVEKEKKLELSLRGYVSRELLDFSEENIGKDILQIKGLIVTLENREATLKILFNLLK